MTVRILVNPSAGSGAGARKIPAIRNALRGQGLEAELVTTRGPGDAARLAREAVADKVQLLVVVGGDGTLNEACQGLLDDSGRPVINAPRLGLISAGTGGDFRKTFGIGASVDEAVRILARGRTRPLDLGTVSLVDNDGAPRSVAFVNIMSFGLGGLVDRSVNAGPKWLGGRGAFFLGTLRALARYRNVPVAVRVDGQPWLEGPVVNVALANGQFFGGGMHVAPEADPSDGLLDVVAMGDLSLRENLALTPHIYRGKHLSLPGIKFRRGKLVEAETLRASDQALIDLDGETPGRLPIRAELHPGALELVC